jgi:serine/threonine protein kinase
LPESKARNYFQQIIYGVDYCHRHLIWYVKPLKP